MKKPVKNKKQNTIKHHYKVGDTVFYIHNVSWEHRVHECSVVGVNTSLNKDGSIQSICYILSPSTSYRTDAELFSTYQAAYNALLDCIAKGYDRT